SGRGELFMNEECWGYFKEDVVGQELQQWVQPNSHFTRYRYHLVPPSQLLQIETTLRTKAQQFNLTIPCTKTFLALLKELEQQSERNKRKEFFDHCTEYAAETLGISNLDF